MKTTKKEVTKELDTVQKAPLRPHILSDLLTGRFELSPSGEEFIAEHDVESMTKLELQQAVKDRDQAIQEKKTSKKT